MYQERSADQQLGNNALSYYSTTRHYTKRTYCDVHTDDSHADYDDQKYVNDNRREVVRAQGFLPLPLNAHKPTLNPH